MVFQILLTERARTRAGVGGGGRSGSGGGVEEEESLKREEAERRELFLSRQAFVSPGPASCSSLPSRAAVTVCSRPPPPHHHTPQTPSTPPPNSPHPLSLQGQLLGLCSRGIVGDYPVWPLMRSGRPLNGANRVVHNPSYIFHRAFLTTSQQRAPKLKDRRTKGGRGERLRPVCV